MVSIERLTYVVNTHKGKRRFKDINHAIQFLQTWQQMHESYVSAYMSVEVNRSLHKKKVGV